MKLDINTIMWIAGAVLALFLVFLFIISYIKAAPD